MQSNLASAIGLDLDTLAQQATPQRARDYMAQTEGPLSQLSRLAGQSVQQPQDAGLADADKNRSMLQFGLNLLAQGGDWHNTFGSALGKAGTATLADIDKRRQEQAKYALLDRKTQQGALKQINDYLTGARDFEADRGDETWKRLKGVADLRLDRDKATSVNNYRTNSIDLARDREAREARLAQLRGENLKARTAATRANVNRGTAADREIGNMVNRGIDPGWAQDVAQGNVSSEIDEFGNVHLVNRATGEQRLLNANPRTTTAGGSQGSSGRPAAAQAPSNGSGEGQVFADIAEGTGPIAGTRAAINSVIGPFVAGTPFENTASAQAGIRNFAQDAKTALVNNPRFPVAEQEVVQKLLPNADKFWTDPDAERDKLIRLREFLGQKISQNQNSMGSGNVTQKELGRLSNQNESIKRVLGLMGQPDGGDESSHALPAGVPHGSNRIGTLDGKPVYQSPDGRRLVAE